MPVAVARGELGRGQAHVAAEADAQLADRLAARGRRARARTPRPIGLGDVAVDLLAVQAADVVGLEDLGRSGRRHGAGGYASSRARTGRVKRSASGARVRGATSAAQSRRRHARAQRRANAARRVGDPLRLGRRDHPRRRQVHRQHRRAGSRLPVHVIWHPHTSATEETRRPVTSRPCSGMPTWS